MRFLSTPSGWRATYVKSPVQVGFGISIHALRVEGDVSSAAFTGEKRISIHALRVEGDRNVAEPKR